jgi:hypothetical protein
MPRGKDTRRPLRNRAHRRPAPPRADLGLLLGQAMAQHRHVPGLLQALRERARTDAVPARWTPGGPTAPDGACGWSSSAGPARISPAASVTCSPCCARTCTRPALTPSGTATRPPSSPRGSSSRRRTGPAPCRRGPGRRADRRAPAPGPGLPGRRRVPVVVPAQPGGHATGLRLVAAPGPLPSSGRRAGLLAHDDRPPPS